jgi:hypothetical protein
LIFCPCCELKAFPRLGLQKLCFLSMILIDFRCYLTYFWKN